MGRSAPNVPVPQAEAAARAKAKEDLKAFLLSNEANKKVGRRWGWAGGGRTGGRGEGGKPVVDSAAWRGAVVVGCLRCLHRLCVCSPLPAALPTCIPLTAPLCLLPAPLNYPPATHAPVTHAPKQNRSRRRRQRRSACVTWSTCVR